MGSRKSQLDLAIAKLDDEIRVLELARQRLVAQQQGVLRKKPPRPHVADKRAAGE